MKAILLDEAKKWLEENCENLYTRMAVFGIMQSMPTVDYQEDLWEIALKEDWANGLMYCDMEGFAIEEDGTLLLLDECGKHAYCPEGRFKIVPRPPEGEEEA